MLKTGQRTPMTMKMTSVDKMHRADTSVKRNVSNTALGRVSGEIRSNHEHLTNKNRYNSCTSIDYQKGVKSVSHMVSAD
jgi:hypothetical protein